ncbi:hypothetical protein [Flavobacterium chungangensis]|uniref:DUF4488 domain-containing protein n=1 Tax=Flavobacterium chungangensis TaxID=2708132 RepID=A0ABV8ZG17_9FLAO
MMKKVILLFSLVFIYSCTIDEILENSNQGMEIGNGDDVYADYLSKDITPPSWIIGTWINPQGKELKFTKNDIVFGSEEYNTVQRDVFYYLFRKKDAEIFQTKTDTTYYLQYKESASDKKKYNFIKISDTLMESTKLFKGIYTKK